MDFVFITDTHFMRSSNVRTGDVLADCISKLDWVIDYCNKNNAILLHGGDFCDKPSVPDEVKNALLRSFLRLKTKCYGIAGNHQLLYENRDFLHKTSWPLFTETGLITDLDSVEFVDLGPVILTSQVPVIDRGKPQIVVFHGFLNSDDPKWNFKIQDLNTHDPVYLCLGHDHVMYDPLQLTSNCKVFRPGSFLRQTRNEEHLRQPQILHIQVTDKLRYKMVEIPTARPYSEIFTAKETTITKAQQRDTYESIIAQINDSANTNLSLAQALATVATEDVCTYANRILADHRTEKSLNKGRL